MRRKKGRAEPPSPPQQDPAKPSWQKFLDTEERPSREDLAASHDVFGDNVLEPVPLPRWLRGKRRRPRDKLS